MHMLALGKTCLLDEGFRIRIALLTLMHPSEGKADLHVSAFTLNYFGNLWSSSNDVTLSTKWVHK